MFRKLSVYSRLLLALLVVSATQAQAQDISVGSIHVSQAIQDAGHSVPLVARRSTVVRVLVDVDDSDVAVSGVDGRLRVFVNNSEVTPVGGIAPINGPFSAPLSPSLSDEDDTLNFELPAPTPITGSNNVDFVVDLDPVPGETNVGNNSGSRDNLTFSWRRTPRIIYTRINFTPSGLGLPSQADVQPGVGDAFVQGIFPVNDGDPNLYQQGAFPTLTWNSDKNTAGVIDGDDVGDLLDFLEACRQLIVDDNVGANDCTFLYGWVKGNPINGNGWARVGGRVAFGNTQHSRHQRTFAHELGHNFGLSHNSSTTGINGWDTLGRLDGNPGTNNTIGRQKGSSLNDIMRGGQLTNTAWVRQSTYQFFYDHACLQPQFILPFLPRMLTFRGYWDPRGPIVVGPAWRFPWESQQNTRIRNEVELIALVEDVQGNVYRVPFGAEMGDDSGKEGEHAQGFFNVMVPVDPRLEVANVRILDPAGKPIFERKRSEAPPQIEIVEPKEGSPLGDRVRLRWNMLDRDSDPRDIQFQVAYSPNGGKRYVPVAVNLPGDLGEVELDLSQVPESDGNGGQLRIFVSDGLNTASAQVDRLTRVPPTPEPKLGFDFRPFPGGRVTAPANETARQWVECTLNSELPTTDGVQGWSFGVEAGGAAIVDITTDGTDADRTPVGLRNGGFERSELTSGVGNEGAISAVVLSLSNGTTLPPNGSAHIARILLETEAPGAGQCRGIRVVYRDGFQGSGEPVDCIATYQDATHFPTKGGYGFSLCGTRSRWVSFDCNGDGEMNLSDSICQLGFLFLGGRPSPCQAAMDFNGDGRRDLSDPVGALSFMFLGGLPPAAGLGCQTFAGCPVSDACQ